MKKLDILNKKYTIDEKISLSIGIYENNIDDLAQYIDNVDFSMHKAKALGKNCINCMHV